MNARALASVILVAAAIPVTSSATNVTINDTCGSSLAGNITGSGNLAVDPGGNLAVNGFSAPFSVGVGQCDTAAAGDKPKCTLFASPAQIEPNGSVTLFARCRTASPITAYTWSGPTAPAVPAGTGGSITLAFPNTGVFSYAVSATNANGAGPFSTQANVLVGPPTSLTNGPACTVSLSPNAIMQNTTSNFRVTCQPDATSYQWDAAETGAPGAAGAAGTLTFSAPGSFTYKVRGVNANATPGPKASATVTVISDGSCVPGPYGSEMVFPTTGISQDAAMPPNYVVAWRFIPGAQQTYFGFQYHSAYNYYYFPNSGQVAVSKCRGDFNVPEACQGGFSQYASYLFPTAGGPYANGSTCNLDPGVTYYVNIKPFDCSGTPSGYCGYRIYRWY